MRLHSKSDGFMGSSRISIFEDGTQQIGLGISSSPSQWPYMVQYLHFRILEFPLKQVLFLVSEISQNVQVL